MTRDERLAGVASSMLLVAWFDEAARGCHEYRAEMRRSQERVTDCAYLQGGLDFAHSLSRTDAAWGRRMAYACEPGDSLQIQPLSAMLGDDEGD
ncbi:MAG: hypothetical protein P4M11_03845 [Candidatus Pacebacteria bacterium]|nr:hypothetical protein [Candidatus Paceibacterota bacterium]